MRRPRPRAVLAALGTLLAAGLATTALTRSWWALLTTLLLFSAVLAVVVLVLRHSLTAVRAVRHSLSRAAPTGGSPDPGAPRVARLEERVTELEGELMRTQTSLAGLWYDQAGTTGTPPAQHLPAHLQPPAVRALVARGDPLDAHAFATQTGVLSRLPAGLLRRLRRDLHSRGYLTRASDVAAVVAAATGDIADTQARRRIQGELSVLSGTFTPTVEREPGRVEGLPGRVLHLVGRSLPADQAGYTLRTHHTAIAQLRAGLDPHVATQMGYANDRGTPVTEVLDGVTYHRIPGPSRSSEPLDVWLRLHTQRVAELVWEVRPAVLHAASDFVNAHTAVAVGGACGVPVVYESRGFWEETWLSQKTQEYGWDIDRLRSTYGLPEAYVWRRAVEERAFREADHVVTLAAGMADRVAAGGVPRDRITVVPNAVDPEAFPLLPRRDQLSRDLRLAPEATVVGYISSLVEYEGVDTLISAYAAVRESADTPTALLIVGDGPACEHLARQAEALGLNEAVFTGLVGHDAILDYYRLIDIFVVPRRPAEICHLVPPLKPFEAFATGRTVVLSNVRALTAIAEESGAAELFEAGDAASLAKVLLSLLKDPERCRELAAAGAAWVRSHRTWAANAQAYVRLYAALGVALPQVSRGSD